VRILFVHPACRFAIWDVARGYRAALGRLLGEESFKDYYLDRHLSYHLRALEVNAPKEVAADQAFVAKLASENILNEAIYHDAQMVFIVSGLNTHPIALKALEKVGIPAAVLLTENPYDDEPQAEWVANYPAMKVFTHERFSAETRGWTYLPHAYDPAVHRPVEPDPAQACDVLLVGTGWRERQYFLESTDWTGIKLRVVGPSSAWPALTERSPIWKHFVNEPVDNATIAPRYAAAKICLNFHRRHPHAYSPNPRAYEIAGCGAFQLSDPRPGVTDLFGGAVPIFNSPEELGSLVRYYLKNDEERRTFAAASMKRVQLETFDTRAVELLAHLRRQVPSLQEA